MNTRRICAVAFLLAGILYFGVALPAEQRLGVVQAEYHRVRDGRRDAQQKLALLRHQDAARKRATEMLQAAGRPTRDPVGALRQSVLKTLEGMPLGSLRLHTQSGPPPWAAQVQISGTGSFVDVVRLAGALAGSGSGVVLERFHMAPGPGGVSFDLRASSLGGRLP